jgi:hypothetical protein
VAEQLRQVLTGLHMLPTESDTNLFLSDEVLDADRRLIDASSAFAKKRSALLTSIGEMVFAEPAH